MSERFTDIAAAAFSFLESAGFHLARMEVDYLRYESPSAVVTIVRDVRSGEIEAFAGLRSSAGQPDEVYSLTDIMGMERVPNREMPWQVFDESKLQPFMNQLADDLRIHARPALVGDRVFFQRLDLFRSAKAKALTRRLRLQQVRSAVERAWRGKNLKRVMELYASIERDLSEVEKKKLDYARRQQAD